MLIYSFVTYEGNSGEDWSCFTWDDEETSLVAHASTDKRGIRWMKQVNVGVCNGLALLVDDVTLVAGFSFLYALHKNLMSILLSARSDAYGIETDHLLYGFGQMLVLDSCSDTEVLQFVIEEIDGVTCLLLTELSQRIREGYVMIFA
jgi:hypothetical protein